MIVQDMPGCCSAKVITGWTNISRSKEVYAQQIFDFLTKKEGRPKNYNAFDVIFINQPQKESLGRIGLKAFTKAGFKLVSGPSNGQHDREVYCFVRANNPMKGGKTDSKSMYNLKWSAEENKKSSVRTVKKGVTTRRLFG